MTIYDNEARQPIAALDGVIYPKAVTAAWKAAPDTQSSKAPVRLQMDVMRYICWLIEGVVSDRQNAG